MDVLIMLGGIAIAVALGALIAVAIGIAYIALAIRRGRRAYQSRRPL
ncbi:MULTISPECIES: hypothetical protein [unclassified Bradyrhizobium]